MNEEQNDGTSENSVFSREAEIIENYVHDIYAQKNPEPKEPEQKDLGFMKLVGLEAVGFGFAGIGSILFSGWRTGLMFYIIEGLLVLAFPFLPQTGFIELWQAITAVITFEAFLAAKGISDGRNSGKVKVSDIAVWSSLAVILLGGAFSTIGLIGDIVSPFWMNALYLLIGVVTSIAGAVLVSSSTENLGFVISSHSMKKDEILEEYRKSVSEWKSDAVKSFWTSRQGKAYKKSGASEYDLAQSPFRDNSNFDQSLTEKSRGAEVNNHWRKIGKTLNNEQKLFLLNESSTSVMEEFNLANLQTASNWKEYAERDFASEFKLEN